MWGCGGVGVCVGGWSGRGEAEGASQYMTLEIKRHGAAKRASFHCT